MSKEKKTNGHTLISVLREKYAHVLIDVYQSQEKIEFGSDVPKKKKPMVEDPVMKVGWEKTSRSAGRQVAGEA